MKSQIESLANKSLGQGLIGGSALAGAVALVLLGVHGADAAEAVLPPAAARKVDFEKDIRPLFATKCLRCHGPDKQESGLRLDDEASAKKGGEIGVAYIPGDSAASPLVHYLAGTDENILMPPEDEGEKLSKAEVGLVRAWIDQGAEWPASAATPAAAARVKKPPEEHWAFHRPVRAPLPEVKRQDWARTPIDRFILAGLEREGLPPSPVADRATLIRRLSLDLIGLPPTPAEVEAFVEDSSPDAYEKLVEKLLASPHYGERWALWWLDVARYADTNGYEVDRPRSVWPYRDWVINAFNSDMPYAQFVTEQMAGDLLPDATLEQRIATGFHRNTYFNEEGGHEYEQFRWESIIDRVHTTSTAFLGLTMACAQCHDHKYDPIAQREYYSFFAFLNNDDEPFVEVPRPEVVAKRAEIGREIDEIEAAWADKFPTDAPKLVWEPLKPADIRIAGAVAAKEPAATGVSAPPSGELRLVLAPQEKSIHALRLEPLKAAKPSADAGGASTTRAPLLSECKISVVGDGQDPQGAQAVRIRAAHDRNGAELAAHLGDDDTTTGWVASAADSETQPATLTIEFEEPIVGDGTTRVEISLQAGGDGAALSSDWRVSVGTYSDADVAGEAKAKKRRRALDARFTAWCAEEKKGAHKWDLLKPLEWSVTHNSTITRLGDDSLLVGGDRPEVELIEVRYRVPAGTLTGIELEALPDVSLPMHGPGRGYYMEDGTFFLSEFTVAVRQLDEPANAKPRRIKLDNPSATIQKKEHKITRSIDGDKLTGWHIGGGAGRRQAGVYEFAKPLVLDREAELIVTCMHNMPHSQVLGRFRILVTSDSTPLAVHDRPAHVEQLLTQSPEEWSESEREELMQHFLSVTPELQREHEKVAKLRRQIPALPTSLVLAARSEPRVSHQHIRGEFRRPGKEVTPAVPQFLHPFPADAPRNRLGLAQWLTSPDNPLLGRVLVNQIWQCYFGRGLVNTPEDFGTQGDAPSHPELLDWMAREFVDGGGSLKNLHRQIVLSAVYRQSSTVDPAVADVDPQNILLGRGPRFRVYAELVRDIVLESSGLLARKIGGPSVFPAQPAGLYDQAFGDPKWYTSTGEDLYRRGLYTFRKRGMQYPAYAAFDAPQQSVCSMKRVRSNTPLQALSLLNEETAVSAAQAMARRIEKEASQNDDGRLEYAFQLCLARVPREVERETLLGFCGQQRQEFETDPDNAAIVAGVEAEAAARERERTRELAVWTAVARVLLNLDETITKE